MPSISAAFSPASASARKQASTASCTSERPEWREISVWPTPTMQTRSRKVMRLGLLVQPEVGQPVVLVLGEGDRDVLDERRVALELRGRQDERVRDRLQEVALDVLE